MRGVKYAPMLHSSSSSIEAAFSQIRMHRGDDPANISRVLACIDGRKTMNSLNANNKMYEGHEETGHSMTSVDKASGLRMKMRVMKLKDMKNNMETVEECEIRFFCATTYESKSGMDKQYIRNDWMKKLYVAMKNEVQLTHFSVLIIKKKL